MKSTKKIILITTLAYMSSLAPLATDMYLPAMNDIALQLRASEFYAQLSLTAFFVAFSLGQLIYGPLSDIFGRKKPILAGVAIFTLASIACIFVDNIAVFIALRFLQALGGCAGVVIARAVINDTFELKEAASAFALMMIVGALAPMLAPSVGSFLENFFGWRSIFTALSFLGGLLLLAVWLFLAESHTTRAAFSLSAVTHAYAVVGTDKCFASYVLVGALAMAMIFAYITGSSFVFMGHFELSNTAYGAIFGLNALAMMIGSAANAILAKRFSPFTLVSYALCGVLVLCVLLFVGSFFELGFIVFEVNLFCAMLCLGFIVPNVTSLAMARFKQLSGTASALFGFTQFALAGGVSALVGALNANSPLALSLVIILCLLLASLIYFASHWKLVRKSFKR